MRSNPDLPARARSSAERRWRSPKGAALTASLLGILTAGCSTTRNTQATTITCIACPTGTDASLRGLCAVSSTTCWAGGDRGRVLRTTDAGKTWQVYTVPGATELEIRDVHGFDADRALVMTAGQPARIYRTDDGGQTFTCTHESPHAEAFLDSIAMWNDLDGLAFSDPVEGHFLILRTRDGGRRWTEIPAHRLPEPHDGEAGFAASGTCIAVADGDSAFILTGGRASRVLRSTDAGSSFQAVATPLRAGEPSTGGFGLAFRNARVGIAVGGNYLEPTVASGNCAITNDGGQSWRTPKTPPSGYRSAVVWLPGSRHRTQLADRRPGRGRPHRRRRRDLAPLRPGRP